ncbi:hypothetical protein ACFQ1E_10595 [Sphingomonas canadensis]|uniref:DUF1761 domain-containing protein n=1 Tax=Sphingomonas canadensis TaxID=1219257 RepID=A0ABW3H5M6_9SPHN|nr:hypothetical protein [Sphingomonas canadensis]MCW3836433.1 hypothetical protein [Sphingomonas canadensis]
MRRLVLGSFAAGLAMWVVGFIFWGPLLGWIPFTAASEANQATLQQALRTTLGPTGTGVYAVPSPDTQIGTVLHAQGPVAIVQFTNAGFPAFDTQALLWGLVLAIVCGFVMGLGLRIAGAHLGFGDRVKLVLLVAVAVAGYSDIGQPVFNHAPWRYWTFAFVADVAAWGVAGVIFARWFLPQPDVGPAQGY